MSSLTPVELPQNYMVGQQIQQVSELQFDNFPNPQSFSVWKIRFKNQATACSDFPSERMSWIKEMEMVESFDECVSSRSTAGKKIPNFEMLDAKIASALNKIIQNYSSSRRRSVSMNRTPRRRTGFYEEDRPPFMIYDYFRVTGAHDTVLNYADFFSVTLHDDSIQEFDTRWMKFYCQCQRFHPMTSWKVCTH